MKIIITKQEAIEAYKKLNNIKDEIVVEIEKEEPVKGITGTTTITTDDTIVITQPDPYYTIYCKAN